MKITHLPKEVSINICGSHYFGCDYIFANIYGSQVFSEDEGGFARDDSLKSLSKNPENGDFSGETLEEFISSDGGNELDLATMPETSKEIEYSTYGTIECDGSGGYIIKYDGDFTPICIHVEDGKVSLNGQEDDYAELVFEKDKRNYICLPESLFIENDTEDNENQSPIMLCLSAQSVENNLKETGGSLRVSYCIEVNGITAEVTDFTLTATSENPSI